jgi:cytochrome oxidase Cu insertion factor (SCO1/SenC/PrrC family)
MSKFWSVLFKICLIIYHFFCILDALSAHRFPGGVGNHASFSGHIAGEAYAGDSIRVIFIRDFITVSSAGSREQKEDNLELFYVHPNGNGMFFFRVSGIKRQSMLELDLVLGKKHQILDCYIIEPGDSICFDILKDNDDDASVRYRGHGSGKYACYDSLDERESHFQYRFGQEVNQVKIDAYSYESLGRLWRVCNSFCDSNLRLIDQYKTRLTNYAFVRLREQSRLYLQEVWLNSIKFLLLDSALLPAQRISLLHAAESRFYPFNAALSDIYASSATCITRLIRAEILHFYLENTEKPSISHLVSVIREKYKGLLREKLFADLILEPNKYQVSNSNAAAYYIAAMSACALIKTPMLKKSIEERFSPLREGSVVYNFTLKDSSNSTVMLSDFKGKTVLIDVWFTGCTGCVMFHNLCRQYIEPALGSNPNLKIISICVDQIRSTWLRSCASGKYSDYDSLHINLFTNGRGTNDPFLQFYQPAGYPFILLVDPAGKLISQITNYDASGSDIINLISRNLLSLHTNKPSIKY